MNHPVLLRLREYFSSAIGAHDLFRFLRSFHRVELIQVEVIGFQALQRRLQRSRRGRAVRSIRIFRREEKLLANIELRDQVTHPVFGAPIRIRSVDKLCAAGHKILQNLAALGQCDRIVLKVEDNCGTDAYYRQLFTPPSLPATQALEALASRPIAVPSLYLHGADDGCMSAQLSEGMEAMFTNRLERVVMPGVGHFLHLEQPDAVLNHILRFLRN